MRARAWLDFFFFFIRLKSRHTERMSSAIARDRSRWLTEINAVAAGVEGRKWDSPSALQLYRGEIFPRRFLTTYLRSLRFSLFDNYTTTSIAMVQLFCKRQLAFGAINGGTE